MDRRSQITLISKYDIKDIVDLGGQAHLENRDTSGYVKDNTDWKDSTKRKDAISGTSEVLFTTRGVSAGYLGLGSNKKFIKFVRHNPNADFTYQDEMNEQYVFKYQPPGNLTGALRYRWMEKLSQILGCPWVEKVGFVHKHAGA